MVMQCETEAGLKNTLLAGSIQMKPWEIWLMKDLQLQVTLQAL
jgi:hypothetical protein